MASLESRVCRGPTQLDVFVTELYRESLLRPDRSMISLFVVCSLALLAARSDAVSPSVNKWLGVGSGSRAGSHMTNSILNSRYNSNGRASSAMELFMAGMEVRRLG